MSIPPNYVLTGPLSLPQTDLVKQLKIKDSELFDWIEQAASKNQKVVYVSIGSVCKWQQWSVDAMYHGLKKVGCRIIWSLKDFELPEENPDFWTSPWVPQIEVLAHPAV